MPPPGWAQPSFGSTPVGAVIAFAGKLGPPLPAGASPPDVPDPVIDGHVTDAIESLGWMLCDGRQLQTGQYPELFAALGYLYGGSDNTFMLPDYRGYFLRGEDAGALVDKDSGMRTDAAGGETKSQTVGSRQTDALHTHQHAYDTAPAPATPSQSGKAAGSTTTAPTLTSEPTDDAQSPPGTINVSQYETRPINIYVNYLIKFTYGLLQTS